MYAVCIRTWARLYTNETYMGGAVYEWKRVVEGVSVALVREGGPALVQRRDVEANLRTSETVYKLALISSCEL